MNIYHLLRQRAFGPEEVELLRKAYEEVIASLEPPAFSGAGCEWIAKRIIALGQSGELDLDRLVTRVRSELATRISQ